MGFEIPSNCKNLPVEIKPGEDPFGDCVLCLYYGRVAVAYFCNYDSSMVLCKLSAEDIEYLAAHDLKTNKRKGTNIVTIDTKVEM